MNIYVILAYFVFIADVLVCFSLYFYSYFLFNGNELRIAVRVLSTFENMRSGSHDDTGTVAIFSVA